MSENCMANCMAKQYYLQLRNKIFYYRVELPRVNNKRRYKIISLHTQNYFEAKERIKQMVTLEENFAQLKRLFNNLIFETADNTENVGLISRFPSRKLSKRNNIDDVTKLYELYNQLSEDIKNQTLDNQKLIQTIAGMLDVIIEYIGPINTYIADLHKPTLATSVPITSSYTISDVLESMLLLKKAKNVETYQKRKRQAIVKMLESVGLSLDDDYTKFYDVTMITNLSKKIIDDKSLGNDYKKIKIQYLKELAIHGNTLNPDIYKANILNNFPEISGTKKADKNPHLPYSDEQLLEIFDFKHDYFKNNPDTFWACVIALFTGARINAAITLQYMVLTAFNLFQTTLLKNLKMQPQND